MIRGGVVQGLRGARAAWERTAMDALQALLTRRSPAQLREPAPDGPALQTMLDAAMRAPDHGKLRPWRFLVLRGDARARFGALMPESLNRRETTPLPHVLEKERV